MGERRDVFGTTEPHNRSPNGIHRYLPQTQTREIVLDSFVMSLMGVEKCIVTRIKASMPLARKPSRDPPVVEVVGGAVLGFWARLEAGRPGHGPRAPELMMNFLDGRPRRARRLPTRLDLDPATRDNLHHHPVLSHNQILSPTTPSKPPIRAHSLGIRRNSPISRHIIVIRTTNRQHGPAYRGRRRALHREPRSP